MDTLANIFRNSSYDFVGILLPGFIFLFFISICGYVSASFDAYEFIAAAFNEEPSRKSNDSAGNLGINVKERTGVSWIALLTLAAYLSGIVLKQIGEHPWLKIFL